MNGVYKLTASTLILATSAILSSCGSSDGVNGGNAPVRTAGQFSGVAHDAPLKNATVKVYDWSNGERGALIAETTTDSSGNYQLQITTSDKPVMITAGDKGTYTEEASGRTITLTEGQYISAITNYQSGEILTLQVSPFTHLARCYAEYLIDNGESVPDALNLANSKMASVAGVEIIKTKPVDVTDINSANIELTPGLKYGFLTAAISASMVDVSESNGLDAHSERFLTSMQYSRVACNDIKADGLLDGNGYIDNTTIGALSFGTYNITPAFYRNLLAQRILSFAKSDENKTGLDISKLLIFANSLSNNTDSMWAGLPAQSVDITGPTVEALTAAHSFIGGTAEIPFLITDPIGVQEIEFYVDDALVSTQAGDSQTLNLNTKNYLDGSHEFKIIAADLIGNETTFLVSYNISNTGPAINLTSNTITGEANYLAQGTWVSSGADIQTVTVDGETATINPDGTWSALIELNNGSNTIGVTAVDTLNNSTTQSYIVGLDMNNPLITEIVRYVRQTTYNGQYSSCNYVNFVNVSTDPICIRSDRVSLNGFAADGDLDGNDFMYIKFRAEDTVGAGVFSEFDDLTIEYQYLKNAEVVKDWQALTTGYKSTIPGALYGTVIIPVTTEYLGDDWFNTDISDTHVINIRVTDSVGHFTVKPYTMQFDVLVYNLALNSSTNGETVMAQSFESRASLNGSVVTTKAIIENPTDNPIYFELISGDNHSVEQVYENAVRVNKMAVKSTETWRTTDYQFKYINITSAEAYDGSSWIPIEPQVKMSDYVNVYKDVMPDTPPDDWSENSDFTCPTGSGFYMGILTGLEGGLHMQMWGNYRYTEQTGAYAKYACNSKRIFNPINPASYDEYSVVRMMEKYVEYENVYKPGYPRNESVEVTLNHAVNDSTVSVYNQSASLGVEKTNGYYVIPAGQTVEVIKTIPLPNVPHRNDLIVADLDALRVYEPKELDKTITYDLDESINLKIYAVLGASAFSQQIGTKNTYTISR